jgi:Icc protein
MSGSIAWVHIGDLHLESAAPENLERLADIVAEVADNLAGEVDLVFLPGDNANHGEASDYAAMCETLGGLPAGLPWRIIPGDHDYEPGDLRAYEAAIPEENRPEGETIGTHRCIYLDIVSAGHGGPDFRLTMHHRNRLREELATAAALGQVPLVFMHAFPCDLAADGDEIARTFAAAGVAFVDTGHTHYNELLNDGAVIYGATRSTGQIEEDGGAPGYTIVAVHDRVPSWRFRRLGAPWPHVQIVSPCDLRLVTRPHDPAQVARPGAVEIVARVFGDVATPALLTVDDGASMVMARGDDGCWRARIFLPAGRHAICVRAGGVEDRIDLLVRPADQTPKRYGLVSPGHSCHSIGAWPVAGIDGFQLGPNRNGGKP